MFSFFKPKPLPPPEPPVLQPSHVVEFNAQIETLNAKLQAIGMQLEEAMQRESEREKTLLERIDALEKENAALKAQLATMGADTIN